MIEAGSGSHTAGFLSQLPSLKLRGLQHLA